METGGGSKKLQLQRFPRLPDRKTAEAKHWRRFRLRGVEKQIAPATHIEFSPVEPHDFAVTASTRVAIYSAQSDQVKKTISRFTDIAYSGSFRYDGRVVVAGNAAGVVQLFDVGSRTILRTFKGHEGDVRVTRVSRENQILSGGDDKTLRCWDVSTGEQLLKMLGHDDYIRAGLSSPVSPSIWITGSYDHTVKLWDVRAGGKSTMSLDHGHPVEDVIVFPSGGLVVSAGQNYIKIWDILGGGRCVQTLSNHQKTITQVALNGSATRLLTGSLDHHVKVYDVSTYKVVHSMKYPDPVLAMAISPDDTHLVVSTTDGNLHVRHRELAMQEKVQEQRRRKMYAGTHRFFVRGRHYKPRADDAVVEVHRKEKLQQYEKILRKFEYQRALDAAFETKNPIIVSTMLTELFYRNGLRIALSNRDEAGVALLLRFAIKYISDPRYAPMLWEMCSQLLEMYAGVLGQSQAVDGLFMRLRNKIRSEIEMQKDLYALMGQLELMMSVTSLSAE